MLACAFLLTMKALFSYDYEYTYGYVLLNQLYDTGSKPLPSRSDRSRFDAELYLLFRSLIFLHNSGKWPKFSLPWSLDYLHLILTTTRIFLRILHHHLLSS